MSATVNGGQSSLVSVAILAQAGQSLRALWCAPQSLRASRGRNRATSSTATALQYLYGTEGGWTQSLVSRTL